MHIRPAAAADLADIRACARLAYARYVVTIGREPAPMNAEFQRQITRGQVFVAISGASFSGYVVFYREKNHLHLENVAVLPEQAGQGIGKSLIEFVEHSARMRELDAVELYTNAVMTENLEMYARLGYVETARKRQDGFDRVFFRKSIFREAI